MFQSITEFRQWYEQRRQEMTRGWEEYMPVLLSQSPASMKKFMDAEGEWLVSLLLTTGECDIYITLDEMKEYEFENITDLEKKCQDLMVAWGNTVTVKCSVYDEQALDEDQDWIVSFKVK